MTAREGYNTRELKARLETRLTIIKNDMAGLEQLADEMTSEYYKGHVQGQIATMLLWRNDITHTLDLVNQHIKEAENG